MTPPRRKPTHAEDGFALIEVLVSALVLAIVAAGVVALLQATTRSAANERRYSEGHALAQEDQARMRSMRLSALNRLKEERKLTIDGNTFTVLSEGVFINNSTRQPAACTSGTTAADYVRITSTVTWPGVRQPVVMKSMVSPSNGSLDPNRGTLIVSVKSPSGEGIAGLPLAGSGPGIFSGSTDSTGCANFSDLPAGSYTVTPTSTTLVGKDGKHPHGVSTDVSAGTTSTLSLEYAKPASIPVEFEYRLTSTSPYKPAKLDSAYFYNTSGSAAYWTTDKTRQLSLTAAPIYPFPSQITMWAGSCSGNSPESTGKVNRTFLAGEVATTPVKLKVPAFEVTVTSGGSPVKGAEITLSDDNCNDEDGDPLMRTYTSEAGGHQAASTTATEPEYGIPSGTYDICASAFYSGTYHRKRESNVVITSHTSTTKRSLALPSTGTETGSTRKCP
ncbi:MAG TPA: prepilin-type N-terminal cleavage/methylation domain-containing protein [Solirubrobacterales bacterium]